MLHPDWKTDQQAIAEQLAKLAPATGGTVKTDERGLSQLLIPVRLPEDR